MAVKYSPLLWENNINTSVWTESTNLMQDSPYWKGISCSADQKIHNGAKRIQSAHTHPRSFRSTLTLTLHPTLFWCSHWSHSFWSFDQHPVYTALLSCVCYMPINATFPTSDPLIFGKGHKYEAPHYAVLSSLMLQPPSWVQIFSSASCSQTPTFFPEYDSPSLISTQSKRQNYSFIYFNLYTFR
jgi:hypothetical protein